MFAQICEMAIPLDFETEEEKQKVKNDLEKAFNELKNLAVQLQLSNKVLASLEAIFKKHTNLHQQKKISCGWVHG